VVLIDHHVIDTDKMKQYRNIDKLINLNN